METIDISLTRSERELLKAVHRMAHEGHEAHTGEVAEQLGLAAGTVTMGIKRLADRDVLIHRPYKGVELTSKGELLALAVIRRHRIVESFLASMLGYEGKDIERLAKSFEHQLPDEVEDRLFEALGEPQECPHGYPIPASNTSQYGEPIVIADLTIRAEDEIVI